MQLGELKNLRTLRINSIFALDLVERFSNITDLTIFGNLGNCRNIAVSLSSTQLKRLDFSEVGKGYWLKNIVCPNLEELKVSLGLSFYGSGVSVLGENRPTPYNAAATVVDPDMPLSELLDILVYFARSGAWERVNAVVAPNFKLTQVNLEHR